MLCGGISMIMFASHITNNIYDLWHKTSWDFAQHATTHLLSDQKAKRCAFPLTSNFSLKLKRREKVSSLRRHLLTPKNKLQPTLLLIFKFFKDQTFSTPESVNSLPFLSNIARVGIPDINNFIPHPCLNIFYSIHV